MSAAMEFPSAPDVAACVALAEAIFGRQQGWHRAALALGISERTARGIAYREATGATVCPHRALEARLHFSRLRTAQLRAELEHLEGTMHADTPHLARNGAMVAANG